MNLIASILNNICPGTGIKISNPHIPSAAAPLLFSIDEVFLRQYVERNTNGMFKWDGITGSIGPGGVFVGRKFYTIAGSSGNNGTALYSVKVEFGTGGSISASVVSTASLGQEPTDTVCYMPIYEVAVGVIVHDYRGTFVVQCWE